MKQKRAAIVLLIVFLVVSATFLYSKRPYPLLKADHVQSIEFYHYGYMPFEGVTGTALREEDIEKCLQVLNQIKDFERVSKPMPLETPVGAAFQGFDVICKDGKEIRISLFANFVVVNDNWYHADLRSRMELEYFFHGMLIKYFPHHEDLPYFYGNIQSLKMWFEKNGNAGLSEESKFPDIEIPELNKNDSGLAFFYENEQFQ